MTDLARRVGEFASILAAGRGNDLDRWMKLDETAAASQTAH